MLLLLFLTIPFVYSADPKCPSNFTLVKRTPTGRNHFTKAWCLGIFEYDNVGNHDRARAVCSFHNATLSMPENKNEFEVLAKEIRARNISKPHAIDGELSPKCKAKFYATKNKGAEFNVTTMKGECNYKKNLYFFDDEFTDPTFVLSMMGPHFPMDSQDSWTIDEPKFRKVCDCMTLDDTYYTGKRSIYNVVNCNYCTGLSGEVPKDITSVICGRRPL
uniref:C-type lectin domain-containing protein n=1 Tax=Caenorhabditis tropicalis TaxID=1561998 RepID=A0A1I7UDL1_9PELO